MFGVYYLINDFYEALLHGNDQKSLRLLMIVHQEKCLEVVVHADTIQPLLSLLSHHLYSEAGVKNDSAGLDAILESVLQLSYSKRTTYFLDIEGLTSPELRRVRSRHMSIHSKRNHNPNQNEE